MNEGVETCCERNEHGAGSGGTYCLLCGYPFELQAALLVVRAAGEWLGYVCTCCIADDARARFEQRCRQYEATQ